LRIPSANAHSYIEKSSTEEKGEKAPNGIPQIPLGGFTMAFSGKCTSWLTPDRSPFENSYEEMTGQNTKSYVFQTIFGDRSHGEGKLH
jgi:hypothetical protein